MGHPTKIATCCHCGSRTVLKIAKARHELSCANCGAPLRDLKMLPKAPKPARPSVSHRSERRRFPEEAKVAAYKKTKPRKTKKQRRGWLKNIAEEIFDVVEDIFD